MVKSTKRRFLSLLSLLICFALFCCITACGSGGSRSSDDIMIASFTGSPTSLNAGQSSILTVRVTDNEDKPVSNVTVNFEFTNNKSGATLTTFDGGNTDADGYALAVYKAGTTNPSADVEDTVQASISGSTKAVIITREKPSGLNLTLASDLTNNQMSSGGKASLLATVLDGSGNPVIGMIVTFNLVTNNSGATIITGTATTDDAGEAIWVYTAGSTAGVNDSITATVSGGGYESTDTIIMQID
jgi:hypothetical protein